MTDKNKKHAEYLHLLKTVKLASFPEIDLSKALYLDSLYAFDLKRITVLKALIRSLFFKVPELDIRIEGHPILMLTTIYARNDHDSYWNAIKELFPVKDEIILDNRFTIKKYLTSISFRGTSGRIKSYCLAYKALNVFENKRHRSYLASKMVTCEKYIAKIREQITHTRIVIVFCDTFLFENVMVQFMNHRGVVSVTAQHGQPVFLGWDQDHLNQSQILNFSSDYYMAKGIYSKRQFVKAGFDEKRIVVLGSMNQAACRPLKTHSENVFGVFTDCILYEFADDTGQKLIGMAEAISKKINMFYFIKVHPSDTSQKYKHLVSKRCVGIYKDEYTNEELFGRMEFGIISASAIYLDMLYSHVKCYQLRTKIAFPIVENQADIFESLEQFMDRLRTWRQLSAAEKEQYFAEQQKEYGTCENTGQRIQDFVKLIINH